VVAALMTRESLAQQVWAKGVALPHARLEGLEEVWRALLLPTTS